MNSHPNEAEGELVTLFAKGRNGYAMLKDFGDPPEMTQRPWQRLGQCRDFCGQGRAGQGKESWLGLAVLNDPGSQVSGGLWVTALRR